MRVCILRNFSHCGTYIYPILVGTSPFTIERGNTARYLETEEAFQSNKGKENERKSRKEALLQEFRKDFLTHCLSHVRTHI